MLKKTNKLSNLSASEFLHLLSKGETSVSEYTNSCIENIEALEYNIEAWEYLNLKKLRELALQKDIYLRSWSQDKNKFSSYFKEEKKDKIIPFNLNLPNRLFGIPIGVKDIFNTISMPTQFGSKIYKNHEAGNDARVLTNLTREGGVVAGKTATSEFAVHNPAITKNPFDISLSPGSSSSGSAAAVASHMIPVAISSQTAASTIRPASYCGIIGFKPSYGVIPRTAMLKTTDTLDTVGIMARSVEDIRLVFDVIRVRGPNYPLVYKNYTNKKNRKNKKYRIANLISEIDSNLKENVKNNLKVFINQLNSMALFEVENFYLPDIFKNSHHIHEKIYCKCLSYYFKSEWKNNKNNLSNTFKIMIEKGLSINNDDYLSFLKKQNNLTKEFDKIFNNYDAILCLSAADDAPKLNTIIDPKDHSLLFTMYHVPSISLPILKGSNNLPLGIQLCSRKFSDYDLFEISEIIFKKTQAPEYK